MHYRLFREPARGAVRRWIVGAGFALAWLFPGAVQGHDVAEEMTAAARNFLAALPPEQQAKAVFPLDHTERLNWHLIPRDRLGVPLKELGSAQGHLAYGLLSTALSHRGYLQATTIMSLEQVLRELEQGRGPTQNPELYYFTLFGKPDPKAAWGWRVEGHHLSLNFTVASGEVTVTPSIMGSNPAEVREGPRAGLRVLDREEDLGRQLVRSLTENQRRECVFSETAPPDFISGPGRKAALLEPRGISVAQMSEAQAKVLRDLVGVYVHRCRPELAEDDLSKIAAAGWDKLSFAWAGGLEPGAGCYYRIQGPSFILEFDKTQNNANHVHIAWRNFTDDFGEDMLRRHYEQSPHPH